MIPASDSTNVQGRHDSVGNGATHRSENPLVGRGIIVRSEGRAAFVWPDEVNWVEAERNYARLYLEEGSHTIRETMKDIEARLGSQFVRIHRCHAVNVTRIRELRACGGGDYEVVLHDGTGLKVGQSFRARLAERLERIWVP
ncbi:MAG: hypothetical protein GEU99_23375 [Luteitalea sp.]|nr:hypothetical protein [Luteitalea sp.]